MNQNVPGQTFTDDPLDALQPSLEALVDSIYTGDARRLLRDCVAAGTLDPNSIIEALRDGAPGVAVRLSQPSA